MNSELLANSCGIIPSMDADSLEKAAHMEKIIKEFPQIYITTDHVLHAGVYTRTIMIPAGVIITGALIKRSVNLIICGHVLVFIGDDKVREYNGYNTLVAQAFRKQVFIAKTDTYLTMFFATNAKSVDEAEREFTDDVDSLLSRNPSSINNITLTGE